MHFKQAKQGFTLIELLVVVLIIGILAAIALPQYNVAVAKSRLAQAFILARTIQTAEEVYYLSNNTYTPDISALDIDVGNYQVLADDNGQFLKIQLPNNYHINIAMAGYGHVNGRVEVMVPPNYMEGIMFYFDHVASSSYTGHWCFAQKDTYKKACQSMGGEAKHWWGVTATSYELPL